MSRLVDLLRPHRPGSSAETVACAPGAALPAADDVLHAFDQTVKALDGHDQARAHSDVAQDIVAQLVESALDQQRAAPGSPLTLSQRLGLETVIRADGSRPSLLLTQGEADADHPMAGRWRDQIASTRNEVKKLARATARIQPQGGSSSKFYGTGFLISTEPARVVTNRHVAMLALRRGVARQEASPYSFLSSYRVLGATIEVEFDGEYDSSASVRHAVARVLLPPWPHTAANPSMDIAVLELALPQREAMPAPVPLIRSSTFELTDGLNSVCVIGFPGPPALRAGTVDGIDWGFVDQAIFNERYGFKRIAPGIVHRDFNATGTGTAAFSFGHDATSLGGNSGSAVCAWQDGGVVFGLHFFGIDADTNLAHGFSSHLTAPLLEQLLGLVLQ